MARCVNQINLIFLTVMLVNHADCASFDGNAFLTFKFHRIQQLLAHFTLRDRIRDLDQAVCQRALAVVNMRNNRKVTDMVLVHAENYSISSAWLPPRDLANAEILWRKPGTRLHAVAEPGDGLFHTFAQVDFGLPAQDGARLGDVGLALLGVVHGQRLESGCRPRLPVSSLMTLAKSQDGDFGRVADVDRLRPRRSCSRR